MMPTKDNLYLDPQVCEETKLASLMIVLINESGEARYQCRECLNEYKHHPSLFRHFKEAHWERYSQIVGLRNKLWEYQRLAKSSGLPYYIRKYKKRDFVFSSKRNNNRTKARLKSFTQNKNHQNHDHPIMQDFNNSNNNNSQSLIKSQNTQQTHTEDWNCFQNYQINYTSSITQNQPAQDHNSVQPPKNDAEDLFYSLMNEQPSVNSFQTSPAGAADPVFSNTFGHQVSMDLFNGMRGVQTNPKFISGLSMNANEDTFIESSTMAEPYPIGDVLLEDSIGDIFMLKDNHQQNNQQSTPNVECEKNVFQHCHPGETNSFVQSCFEAPVGQVKAPFSGITNILTNTTLEPIPKGGDQVGDNSLVHHLPITESELTNIMKDLSQEEIFGLNVNSVKDIGDGFSSPELQSFRALDHLQSYINLSNPSVQFSAPINSNASAQLYSKEYHSRVSDPNNNYPFNEEEINTSSFDRAFLPNSSECPSTCMDLSKNTRVDTGLSFDCISCFQKYMTQAELDKHHCLAPAVKGRYSGHHFTLDATSDNLDSIHGPPTAVPVSDPIYFSCTACSQSFLNLDDFGVHYCSP